MKYIKKYNENIDFDDWNIEEYPENSLYVGDYQDGTDYYLTETDPDKHEVIIYKNYKYYNEQHFLRRITDGEIIKKIKNDEIKLIIIGKKETVYSIISKDFNIIF